MKICVIGTGYVGLVAGTCFAETGNDVICMDVDEEKIRQLQTGKTPIYEPGLEELIRRNVVEGRLLFTTNLPKSIASSLIICIAVGTPSGEDGSSDLSHVGDVAREIAKAMDGGGHKLAAGAVADGTLDEVLPKVLSKTRSALAQQNGQPE